MLLVYGFIEEPRLLLHSAAGGGGGKHPQVRPTALAGQLADSQPGLLVAAMVALHENNKVQLEPADHVFKVRRCCRAPWWTRRGFVFLFCSPANTIFKYILIYFPYSQ